VNDRSEGSSARWVERFAALLLASAALATAWSSYQASRWTGEQAKSFAAANAARVESTKASSLANAQTEVDVSVFTEWVNATVRGEEELTTFYRQRFREEFVPAFEAWIATDPFEDPSAAPTPFAMSEYVIAAREEAAELEAAADAGAGDARENVQRATNYVLGVVLFATSLFFAGIATKLGSIRLRTVVLALGGLVFVLSAGWIATFPVSLSI